MLLFRKKITGWDSFVDEATSGVFPYLAAVSNPDAGQWDDITSIVNWYSFGHHTELTTTEVRAEIAALYGTWAGSTADEKEVVASCFVADKADRDTIHSDTVQTENAKAIYGDAVQSITDAHVDTKLVAVVAGNADACDALLQEIADQKSIIVSVDFGLNGIYSTTSTSYSYIPIQVQIPAIADLLTNGTSIECKVVISYNTAGAAAMEYRLLNFTDTAVVAGSTESLPNATWQHNSSEYFDITAYEGKAIRIGYIRVGGTGSDAVSIESAQLILKFS